jgi:hypothetical protein
MESVKILAHNVNRMRISKFGTVDMACKRTGISTARWYRLEQGNYPGIMDGRLLDVLAKSFGITISQLFSLPAPPPRRRQKKDKQERSLVIAQSTRR